MTPAAVDKAVLSRHFSARAGSYDAVADIQRWMADRLCDGFLPRLRAATSAGTRRSLLEIGCGTGYLTARLSDALPAARIAAVDLAPGMLDRARARLGDRLIEWVLADAEALALPERFDAVVSSATFQWFVSPEPTLRRLGAHLKPGGRLAFATFVSGTFAELQEAFRRAEVHCGAAPGRHGPALLAADEWRSVLGSAGFRIESWSEIEKVAHYPSARAFLHGVKALGANNAARSRSPRPVISEMLRVYDAAFAEENGVRVTYRMLFGVAWRDGALRLERGRLAQDMGPEP